MSTRRGDPTAPVVVTDAAGRYLGVVTIRRLLARLGGEVEPPVEIQDGRHPPTA